MSEKTVVVPVVKRPQSDSDEQWHAWAKSIARGEANLFSEIMLQFLYPKLKEQKDRTKALEREVEALKQRLAVVEGHAASNAFIRELQRELGR